MQGKQFMFNAELELEAELEDLMSTLSTSDLELEAEWEQQKAAKAASGRCTTVGKRVGNFSCDAADKAQVERVVGGPVDVATLRSVVEAAAGAAVSLASSSAFALDQANRTNSTRATFCEAFGVMPEFVPPWRGSLRGVVRWKDLGELIAIRLRDVAKILDGGCIHYFCWVTRAHCPDCIRSSAAPDSVFACSDFHGRYLICLGGGFWKAWHDGDNITTDSTLLHEALHIYFGTTIKEKGRSGNANCYERFVLRLHNLFLHPSTASSCAAGVCDLPAPAPASILDRFGFDQAAVPPFHGPLIGNIAHTVVSSWNTPFPVRSVQVVGFADSRGTAAYNAALGQRRATAVHGQLSSAIGNLGPPVLQKLKFTVGSEGSKKPIALSSTPQGRARNRRVEVSLLQV
jgi:hypothetical protein